MWTGCCLDCRMCAILAPQRFTCGAFRSQEEQPLPSEEGTTNEVFRDCTWQPIALTALLARRRHLANSSTSSARGWHLRPEANTNTHTHTHIYMIYICIIRMFICIIFIHTYIYIYIWNHKIQTLSQNDQAYAGRDSVLAVHRHQVRDAHIYVYKDIDIYTYICFYIYIHIHSYTYIHLYVVYVYMYCIYIYTYTEP